MYRYHEDAPHGRTRRLATAAASAIAIAIYGLATFLLGLTLCLGRAHAADFSVTRDYVRPVLIYTPEKPTGQNGSMIVIRKGYAVTARHVVNAAGDVGILSTPTGENRSEMLEVVSRARFLDIAVVRGNIDCPCAPLGDTPAVDATVVAVGYPNYFDFRTQWLSLGLVQRVAPIQIVHSANTAPGMSGGGVFAEQGGQWVLVGVAVAIATSNTTRQELNWVSFAHSIRAVKGFLSGVKELTE